MQCKRGGSGTCQQAGASVCHAAHVGQCRKIEVRVYGIELQQLNRAEHIPICPCTAEVWSDFWPVLMVNMVGYGGYGTVCVCDIVTDSPDPMHALQGSARSSPCGAKRLVLASSLESPMKRGKAHCQGQLQFRVPAV